MKRFIRSYFIPNIMGILALIVLATTFVLAQTSTSQQPTSPDANTIITILAPVVVYLATKLVALIMAKFGAQLPSAVITAVIVPVLSLAAMFIAQWAGGTNPWYVQFILGFAGTFTHELINNFQKPTAPSQ